MDDGPFGNTTYDGPGSWSVADKKVKRCGSCGSTDPKVRGWVRGPHWTPDPDRCSDAFHDRKDTTDE